MPVLRLRGAISAVVYRRQEFRSEPDPGKQRVSPWRWSPAGRRASRPIGRRLRPRELLLACPRTTTWPPAPGRADPPLVRPQRTLAIGAAFGVISVRGPRQAGMVEVATFRQDAAYSDGRHPDHVTFSSAQEDALRRDFTINGLFFDPVEGRVIDFVGGQEDLARQVIRAIGPPASGLPRTSCGCCGRCGSRPPSAFDWKTKPARRSRQMADQIGRQRRAHRHGDAAACWSSRAAARPCGCCWRRAWPPPCCRRSCRPTSRAAAAGACAGRA